MFAVCSLIHVLTHILENVKKISENFQYYVKKIEAESKKNGFLIKKIVYAKEHGAKTLVDITGVFF